MAIRLINQAVVAELVQRFLKSDEGPEYIYNIVGLLNKGISEHPTDIPPANPEANQDFVYFKIQQQYNPKHEKSSEGELPELLVLKYPSMIYEGMEESEFKQEIKDQSTAIRRIQSNIFTNAPKYYYLTDGQSNKYRVIVRKTPFDAAQSAGIDVSEFVIIRDYIEGNSLSGWLGKYKIGESKVEDHPKLQPADWLKMARLLVDALMPIHNIRLVHGDLRPRNIILVGDPKEWTSQELCNRNSSEIILLDIEDDTPGIYLSKTEAIGTFRRKYDSPLKLYEKKREGYSTNNFPPYRFKRDTATWSAPTDLFSLGTILLDLACGSNVHVGPFQLEDEDVREHPAIWYRVGAYQVEKSERSLRRSLLERLNLCHPNNPSAAIGMGEVILACLRSHVDGNMADLRTIASIIEEFHEAIGGKHNPVGTNDDKTKIERGLRELVDPKSHLFEDDALRRWNALPGAVKNLAIQRALRSIVQLRDLINQRDDEASPDSNNNGFLRVFGIEQIADALVVLLGTLQRGQSCRALLTPYFFSEDNLSPTGKLTAAIQLALYRGVNLEWILAVHHERLFDAKVAEIIQGLQGSLKHKSAETGLFYAVATEEEWTILLKDQSTSIVVPATTIEPPKEDTNFDFGILAAPDYHGDGGHMAALRIWPHSRGERHQKLLDAFKNFSFKKISIEVYQR